MNAYRAWMDFDRFFVVADGWYELRAEDADASSPRVLAKVEDRGGRLGVVALIVVGALLDSATLRAIPLRRIESAFNHPHKYGHMRTPLDDQTREELADVLHPDDFTQIETALIRYLAAPVPAMPTPLDHFVDPSAREPLTRPDGSDPDGFYRRVAEAYNDVILGTSAPAPVLAAEAGVPTATVHRWIFEARRRGFLPPARKGRAG